MDVGGEELNEARLARSPWARLMDKGASNANQRQRR
jgi:hypothetical protein